MSSAARVAALQQSVYELVDRCCDR